jgi:hypothetical protein
MYVVNGEASFLDHHVASIWDFSVEPEHPGGTRWKSGQLSLSSLIAVSLVTSG